MEEGAITVKRWSYEYQRKRKKTEENWVWVKTEGSIERESVGCSVMSNSLGPHGLYPAKLLCPWDSPGKNTGVRRHSLLWGMFPTQELNPGLLHRRQILCHLSHHERTPKNINCHLWQHKCWSLRHVWLFVTPWTVAQQAPLSVEFSRQEYWSGLPCPSPGDLPNPGIKPRSPALQADS